MKLADIVAFAWGSLKGSRARSVLMVIAMAIGVGAVVVLTALGEGARRYVVREFSSLGTHLIIVFPGRTETGGNMPGMMVGRSPRDLTLEDALTLLKSRHVSKIAPLNIGTAQLSWAQRSREATVLGTTHEFLEIRGLKLVQGRFLPGGDPMLAEPVCVIGIKLRAEMFGAGPALGQWVRIGERRYRVIGVLGAQGQALGFNIDEIVIIPVASAQQLFNQASLVRILVEAKSREALEAARDDVKRILKVRHEGEEDVTVVTQDAVLATFDRILRTLTMAVGGIAAISLAVAGILIMNVMLIAVSQRTREIGLLKAVGASAPQIRSLFFAEAIVLSAIGATVGYVLGEAGIAAIGQIYPKFPAAAPPWAVGAALATAVATGIVFSLAPARRAAQLDPVAALARR
ncbi:MAG TPA: ABC transporter permease [Burkholderiales bacterium]|jgi:putative ABC transport system permease protein|nr:ABC transporter permease [Burkholderiales bacterium]